MAFPIPAFAADVSDKRSCESLSPDSRTMYFRRRELFGAVSKNTTARSSYISSIFYLYRLRNLISQICIFFYLLCSKKTPPLNISASGGSMLLFGD